jgi:hypothetical protein
MHTCIDTFGFGVNATNLCAGATSRVQYLSADFLSVRIRGFSSYILAPFLTIDIFVCMYVYFFYLSEYIDKLWAKTTLGSRNLVLQWRERLRDLYNVHSAGGHPAIPKTSQLTSSKSRPPTPQIYSGSQWPVSDDWGLEGSFQLPQFYLLSSSFLNPYLCYLVKP